MGVRNLIATVSIVHDDPHVAAKEAVFELTDRLGQPPAIVVLFFSAEFPAQAIRDGLWSELDPATTVVGCSSSAELGPDGALTHSVTALGMCLPGYRAQALSVPGGRDSYAIGQQLVESVQSPKPDLLLLFPDVLTVNATRLLQGIQSRLGAEFPVLGGAAADMGTFKQVELIHGKEILRSGAVALALFGPVTISAAACSGYSPVSVPLQATRVDNGNILLELDGKPALTTYLEQLGPRKSEMPGVTIEYPIGVVSRVSGKTEVQTELVRAVFGINEQREALVLGGDIPERAELCILSATRKDVLMGTHTAIQTALTGFANAELALLFNCVSRKVILGPRYKEEYSAVDSVLPKSLPRIGFYTFGELSPVAAVTQHHESTFTIALVHFGTAK